MAKSWVHAKNIYGVINWVKSVNNMADKDEIDGIMFEAPDNISRWNKKCYLEVSPWFIRLAVPKSNLYWGVVYEFNKDQKESVYKLLKQLCYKLPIILNTYEYNEAIDRWHIAKTFTYTKYDSKVKLLESELNYDPNRKTSESCS